MPFRSFLLQLLIASGISAALYAAMWPLAPAGREHLSFALLTIGLFAAVCVLLYALGRLTARRRNQAFLGVVIASVFGKMVLALGYLAWYKLGTEPENNWYVGIFLLIYAIFTAFEIHFMTKIGQTSPAR